MAKDDAATEKQLKYINDLGYSLTRPRTKEEASFLIDLLKAGNKPTACEAQLIQFSKQQDAKSQREMSSYLDSLDDMSRDLGMPVCAGFRVEILEAGIHDPHLMEYDGAFLPFEHARSMLLLISVPGVYIEELERRPSRGKTINAAGRVTGATGELSFRAQSRPDKSRSGCSGLGCVGSCLTTLVVIAGIAVGWIVFFYWLAGAFK